MTLYYRQLCVIKSNVQNNPIYWFDCAYILSFITLLTARRHQGTTDLYNGAPDNHTWVSKPRKMKVSTHNNVVLVVTSVSPGCNPRQHVAVSSRVLFQQASFELYFVADST